MTPLAYELGNALLKRHREVCANFDATPESVTELMIQESTVPYRALCEGINAAEITGKVGNYLNELAEWCQSCGLPPINALGIVAGLYAACLVLAGWKYTHPVRNLSSVTKNRWNSYSHAYSLGYTRGFRRAKLDLGAIAEANKTGALGDHAFSKDLETRSLAGLEVEAKSSDELKGSRDGYHDVMDHIWENLK